METTDRIYDLLGKVPRSYTYTRRERKNGNPVVTITAKKPDPEHPEYGKERFEVEGSPTDVANALEWWLSRRVESEASR